MTIERSSIVWKENAEHFSNMLFCTCKKVAGAQVKYNVLLYPENPVKGKKKCLKWMSEGTVSQKYSVVYHY